jgi:ketosteroid isomerase-like protein
VQREIDERTMNVRNAAEIDRADIERTTAELLAAVNVSDADRCGVVWAIDGVLMPPHHPPVHGHDAIVEYFRNIFSRGKFKFTFTSSQIHFAADTAFEHVTYTAIIWRDGSPPMEDVGKGLHVYRRQPGGSWKLIYDIWNSDRVAGPQTT